MLLHTEHILKLMSESESEYNVKVPVTIELDPKKPLQSWRVELHCTVKSGGFTHTITFKTMLSGVLMRW